MTLSPSFLRRSVAAILGIAVLAAGGYGYWWWHLAGEVRAAIGKFAEDKRAAGWEVHWSSMAVSGFPGALEVRLDAPAIRTRDGISWEGPALTGRIRPWDLTRADIAAPGRHQVVYDGRPFMLEADQAVGRLWTSRGRLTGGEIGLTGVNTDRDLQARRLYLRVERSGDWMAGGALEQLDLPADSRPVLGRRIEAGAFRLRVKGPIGGVDPAALAAWRDDGGLVEVEHADTSWGPLGVALTGKARLDPNMQPAGAFDSKVQGHDATLDAFARAGMLDPRVTNVAKMALGLLAWRAEGKPTLEVPFTIQDRHFSVGPIRLFRIPQVDWSKG